MLTANGVGVTGRVFDRADEIGPHRCQYYAEFVVLRVVVKSVLCGTRLYMYSRI